MKNLNLNFWLLPIIFFIFNSNVIYAQIITTIAGTGAAGYSGDGIAATASELNAPYNTALDSHGNIYIVDGYNSRIRKINSAGIISTFAGNGGVGFSGDGGQATAATLNEPVSIALDKVGNVYISDWYNYRIRKIDTFGIISTVAGNGTAGFSGDGGAATLAQLYYPFGVAVDTFGNLYISDLYNNRIRKVDTTNIISTIAGNGIAAFGGDGGPAGSASLHYPFGLAVDNHKNIYIADADNNRIRKIDSLGIIHTIAGNGAIGYSGDGMAATSSKLNHPTGVCVDNIGNVFIADFKNNRIRFVDSLGIITTKAGDGIGGFAGDGGPATAAKLDTPAGVALDNHGNIYISDFYNNRVRKLSISSTEEPNTVSSYNSLKIYPNPASNIIFIFFPFSSNNVTASILDINGITIATEKDMLITNTKLIYDTRNLSKGNYFIIVGLNGTIYKEKFMVL